MTYSPKGILTLILAMSAVLFSAASLSDQDSDIEKIRTALMKMVPAAQDAEIVPSPVDGVYRVEVQGNYVYIYADGDFVLIGDLYDTEKQANLGKNAGLERMAKLVADTPESKMIVFGPKKPQRYITVFTDIDCGYCRKLHREVQDLNEAGIQVRYLAFPRAGIGSASYDKYVSVWCNADPKEAMTTAKSGREVDSASCDNPVAENYKLGQQVGIRGTPTIVFDDGTVAPGYIPSKQLIDRMGLSSPDKS